MNVTPHAAQNTSNRRSAIDARTTRHPGYGVSQLIRKRLEKAFGGIKTGAGQDNSGSGAPRGSASPSHSPQPPTTSSGCPSCSRRPGDGKGSRLR